MIKVKMMAWPSI